MQRLGLALAFTASGSILASQTIEAKAEHFQSIPIGEGSAELSYRNNYEGFFGQSGPFIDGIGRLYFLDTTNGAGSNHSRKELFSLEEKSTGEYAIRDMVETREWLNRINDPFQVGLDGPVYRGTAQWSAIMPKELIDYSPAYIGRLASGHVVWGGGRRGMDNEFRIATPSGRIEIVMDMPWILGKGRYEYRPIPTASVHGASSTR